jgi:hypothetical protein
MPDTIAPATKTRCARCGFPSLPGELDAAGHCEHCQRLVAERRVKVETERLECAKGRGFAPCAGPSGGRYAAVHGLGKD